MNRRQKIIVSITGIFIVLLALVGLTYTYFLTQIKGNTNNKSISVTTANLRLVYGGDDGSIIGENEVIEPGKTFREKDGNLIGDCESCIKDNIRPAINLKNGITIEEGGDGTKGNPYVITMY